MAADSGANTRTVTLVQASRIVLIVFALPLWLQWHGGYLIGGPVFTVIVILGSQVVIPHISRVKQKVF
jgi:hypothetical protein